MNTISTVDLQLSLVIFPDNSELDDSLGDGDDLEGNLVFWILLKECAVFEGRDEF